MTAAPHIRYFSSWLNHVFRVVITRVRGETIRFKLTSLSVPALSSSLLWKEVYGQLEMPGKVPSGVCFGLQCRQCFFPPKCKHFPSHGVYFPLQNIRV